MSVAFFEGLKENGPLIFNPSALRLMTLTEKFFFWYGFCMKRQDRMILRFSYLFY